MSLNVCSDELLLDLVAPARLASITFLSRAKASLKYWPQAAKIPINHGTAEEVLLAHPDMVFISSLSAASLKDLLVKSGVKVIDVPPAEDFDQIRAVTRMVAAAVGAQKRAQEVLARMDATLGAMTAERSKRELRVLEWGGGGFVPGSGGLFDSMLKAAGARNIEHGRLGYYDLETLLAAKPDVLVYSNTYSDQDSLRSEQDFHPAIMSRYGSRHVTYDSLFDCGVPESAAIARKLQTALDGLGL